MSITLQPTASQVLIKPDNNYTKTEDGYKKSKDSKIIIPDKVVDNKDKSYLVGTILAACDTAGIDFPSGIRHATYTVGMRVVYIGAHVSIVRYKDEVWHLLPGEFIKGIVHEDVK